MDGFSNVVTELSRLLLILCRDFLYYVFIILYIIPAAYTRHCSANVNMKHNRSDSNFGLVGSLLAFGSPTTSCGCGHNPTIDTPACV